jgi:hypothetical protein
MTRIFYYDKPTGNYTGSGVAAIDPSNGKPIMPKNSTLLPPGTTKAKWDGKAWGTTAPKRKKALPPVAPATPVASEPFDLSDEQPVVDATKLRKAGIEEDIILKKAPTTANAEAGVKTVSLPRKNKANRP